MTTPVIPDAKQLAITYLDGVLAGVTVTDKTPPEPEFSAALPLLRVVRVGGTGALGTWGGRRHRDQPRLSVDVYDRAVPQGDAWAVMARVRGAWQDMPGWQSVLGRVGETWEETGPQDRPEEPNTGIDRIGMIVGMSVRPPRSGQ